MDKNLHARPDGYSELLEELKGRIRAARVKAALAVNAELVALYLSIGRDILARQERQGWGAKVLLQLSRDLRRAFPDTKGFSHRNLKYMRTLARELPEGSIGQQLAAQLPWFHSCTLVQKASLDRLLRHLAHHSLHGCPMVELRVLLPNLSRAQVKRLLAQLRQQGQARMEGQGRQARWYPNHSSRDQPRTGADPDD